MAELAYAAPLKGVGPNDHAGSSPALGTMNKRCSTCRKVKSINEFYKRKASYDGIAYSCKECSSTRRREWSRKNPEKAKLVQDRYKNKDIQKYRQRQAELTRIRRKEKGSKSRPKRMKKVYLKAQKERDYLDVKPLSDFLKELQKTEKLGANELGTGDAIHPDTLNKIIKRRERFKDKISEETVDKILVGLSRPEMMVELYPELYE